MRGTTLLQCGLGAWAGCDVSSGPRQYFGDDYFFSLALALRAVSPPLVLTISAWGLRECGYLASRVGSYMKGQYTHTHVA